MNVLHLFIYTVRLVLFLLRSVLFRCYLLLIFFAKDAAPLLTMLVMAVGLWLSWSVSAPWLDGQYALWIAPERSTEPWELFAAVGVGGFALYVLLGWIQRLLRFVLAAFPFPRRPLPPVLHWMPPKHHIRPVTCRIDVPRLPLRFWDGNLPSLTQRLRPELRAILEPPIEGVAGPPMLPKTAAPDEDQASPMAAE